MLSFLADGGVVASAIKERDWSDSPIGRPEQWPAVLKTTVAIVLGSRFPQCIVWGRDLITIPNDAFLPILGQKPDALGRPFSDVWSEVWSEIGPIAEKAFDGEPIYLEDLRLIIERGGQPEEAFFTFCYSPIRDERGVVVGMLDTVVETTQKVQAERQTRLLNSELAHRMKNTLSVVQAIAQQTFKRQAPDEGKLERFEHRLAALAAAQDLLTRTEVGTAPVADLVLRALEPHLPAPDVARIDGPPVRLSGQQALCLSLALHELATNAAKYGALSNGAGRVSVSWTAGEPGSDEPFSLSWAESGGPKVEPPRRSGFGSRLLERMLPREFKGEVNVDYRPEGLKFELSTRMSRLDAPPVA